MNRTADVAVIGLGAMGAAALHALSRRGVRAIGIERFEPGHDKGSSHGQSRAIRLSYAEHPDYVPLLRCAYAAWRDLEEELGQSLMTITGIVEAGHPGSAFVSGSLASALQHGIDHEMLDAAETMRRFPAIAIPDDWAVFYQRDGGFLRPERAVTGLVAAARRRGAEVWTGTQVTAIRPAPGVVEVDTDRGRISADRVIVAAGPWIGELVPELKPHLTLTRQVLGWFAPCRPDLVRPERLPVFVFDGVEDTCYGFPDVDGAGVKAASHRMGRVLQRADDLRQDGDADDEAQIRRGLMPYLPAADGPLVKMQTCLYTRSPDDFFVVDHAAADPRIVLASPCSGHGFKFASVMGDVLADLALDGATVHAIANFRLSRLGGTARDPAS